MKCLLALISVFAMTSSIAFADTSKIICRDEMLPDNNTYGGYNHALKKINNELSRMKVKSVSAPVFLSVTQPTIVCVTVTY